MKKLSSIFAVLAFVFAVGVSFADVLSTSTGYWYDVEEEVAIGPVDLDGDVPCDLEGNNICTIGGQPAFDDDTNAETNAGVSNPSAMGLLKRP